MIFGQLHGDEKAAPAMPDSDSFKDANTNIVKTFIESSLFESCYHKAVSCSFSQDMHRGVQMRSS